ncbi:MAG: zinc ribbon domain-containing protein [Gammaproteobacteria bacterium]|jgi:predicted nucleic acid-binding Zn ribbon protein
MPTYDYRCETNGQTLEVQHRMSEEIHTWGQLCELAGIDVGDTQADAPVRRLATGGQIVKSSSLGEASAPACSTGPCCGGGMCGLN